MAGWTVTKSETAYGPGGAGTQCAFDGTHGGVTDNGYVGWLSSADFLNYDKGDPVDGAGVTAHRSKTGENLIVDGPHPFIIFVASGGTNDVQVAAQLAKG